MRLPIIASVFALSVAAFAGAPAKAMPVSAGGLSATQSQDVTQVRMKRHRHHMRRHMRRSMTPDNLDRGLPGTGPARDMSKTNGGRANDR